jgi:hypothetical protein
VRTTNRPCRPNPNVDDSLRAMSIGLLTLVGAATVYELLQGVKDWARSAFDDGTLNLTTGSTDAVAVNAITRALKDAAI